MSEKAMVLCSGGVDSTTCLALAIEKHGKENVCALSIYYGQKHVKEIQAAKAVLEYYGIEGTSLDLTPVFAYSDCSLLSHSTEDIPEESYAEQLAQRGGIIFPPHRGHSFARIAIPRSFLCQNSGAFGVLRYRRGLPSLSTRTVRPPELPLA